MQVTSMHFKARAREKLADRNLQNALNKLQGNFVRGRAQRIAALDNFDAIRDAAAAIRDRVLADLDVYLETFECNATARGGQVHWAETVSSIAFQWLAAGRPPVTCRRRKAPPSVSCTGDNDEQAS